MNDKKTITNPVKIIGLKCLDCSCGQVNEVKLCPAEDCPLHPFRFGRNPYRKKSSRIYTEEERAAIREHLIKYLRRPKKFRQSLILNDSFTVWSKGVVLHRMVM
ncbi:MAG: hypothetical protein LUG24_08030 [Clostridiales bacterium]|nr:hypothetical protein [Clostridiales bacterium]